MDPITLQLLMSLGGAAAPVVASLIGQAMSAGDRDKAAELERMAVEQFNIPLPELQRLTAEQVGPSALNDVRTDPRLRDAQMRALDHFTQTAEAGGLDPQARAQLAQARTETARQEQAQRQAVLTNMAQRGMGGSGVELAARLAGQQGAADRNAAAGVQAAADAQRRGMAAWEQSAGLAGNMEAADYGRQAQRAAAEDARARYNAATRQQTNVYNAGLNQQQFQNQVGLANARSGAQERSAGRLRGQAQDTRATATGVGMGVGQGLATAGQWNADEERRRRQMENGGGY